jgi:hypothetical protein
VVCAGLSALDEKIAAYELKTTLEDRFIGVAYKYDDIGQSEGWMKSVLDITGGEQSQRQEAARALASDEGAIKAQVNACMQSLLIGVLDKVMTESGVLQEHELRCANWENETTTVPEIVDSSESGDGSLGPEFVVQEVWGIDCYTRKNIAICLETEFDSDRVQTFREKWLLPAINACPADLAHDISNSCMILEGLSFDVSTSLNNDKGTTYDQWKDTVLGKALLKKISTYGPPWLKAAAHLLRRARENMGPDFFRIHPKGHGSIVLCDKLQPNRLVTFYRGEIYPSWRWGEKIDAIAKIQEQKGLKPVLPDFFNMALERPQHDPRGYGLLFVDATRKSNYGSMLSHSCQPSCEVHVVAVNGELRLAITTIREMTIGDELTFDYNAVTESLFEYQSAVCLCGHGRCSGSFLHFAAADCYQQVLNRNSPVASRLANLIKGCTKKVMADEDDRILKRHGFQTAAFGAVSVNRRNANALDKLDTTLDSMDIVPIWLRTYVADTLRYIEYERRALPVALICNDLYDETGNVPVESESSDELSSAEEEESGGDVGDEEESTEEEIEKPVKRSRPEPTFFFYARTQRDYFTSLLADDEDKTTATGAELKREIQKLASAHWKSLDAEAKERWKAKAFADWEKNRDVLANLEEDKKKTKNGGAATAPKEEKKKPKVKSKKKDKKPKKDKPALKIENGKDDSSNKKPRISFQDADAEGVSAMEQRIQQLTQALSRVGRVLDRHREATLRLRNGSGPTISDETLREVTHSPITIMPDEHVVAWMWNHSEGIVRTLLSHTETDICISPELRKSILDTVSKHSILEKFGTPWDKPVADAIFPMSPSEGRERLNEALLELRKDLLDGIQQMASVIKKHKAKSKLDARKKERKDELARAQESPEKISPCSTIKTLLQEMVATVENRLVASKSPESDKKELSLVGSSVPENASDAKADATDVDSDLDPWLQNFNKRFKIEKAADLLLLYAKTGYFFSLNGYEQLKSSPIEVYARDLGNAVPASTIDRELLPEPESIVSSPRQIPNEDVENEKSETMVLEDNSGKNSKQLCDPEDIVSNVVVEYQGDYVLSQLLQWYNGGIGQKPGLPDSLGCSVLPTMKGCWMVDGTTVSNSHTDRATRYQSTTRRRLIEWLKDPLMRGNPWPDDLRKAFVDKEDDNPVADATSTLMPLGSPILDFLVTGDDHNMNSVRTILSRFHSSSSRSGNAVGDGLLSTVDEGRPAEAVSNWVQCENPACQKWRKVPWNIDVDMLPEQFFCKDNFWNSKSSSCDAPEDEWDHTTDAQVGVDGSRTMVESSLDTTKSRSAESSSFKLCDFRLGGKTWRATYIRGQSHPYTTHRFFVSARFDVRRDAKKGWAVGTVVKLDLAGDLKRIMVHYANMQIKYDEWIEIDSPRIAPLYSHVQRRTKKENSDSCNKARRTKKSKSKDKKGPKSKKVAAEKKDSSSSQSNEIADDMSIEGAGKTHVVHTDDSSMADVFVQDSDDDDDENSVPKKSSKPALPKRTSVQESEEENSFDSVASDSGGDALEDSDDDGEDDLLTKARSVAVTDESSPEEAKKNSEKPSASTWTIPKKRNTPVKSLLPVSLPVQDESLTSASPGDKSNSANRIPRKRPIAPVSQSQSLLMTEPKLASAPIQDLPKKTNGSASAPPPTPSGKQNAKLEVSSPDSRSQGRNRGEYPRNDTTYHNERPPYNENTGYRESNRDTAGKPNQSFHGPRESTAPQDDPAHGRFWSNRPSNSDRNQNSPNKRDFRGHHDGSRPERERSVHKGAGYEKLSSPQRDQNSPNKRDFRGRHDDSRPERERSVHRSAGYEELSSPQLSSPQRDQRYHGDAANDYRGRDRDVYDGYDGSRRNHAERPPYRSSRYDESLAAERDYPNRLDQHEWGGYRPDRQAGNYNNEDRYNYAADYGDRRYDRQYEGTTEGFDDERRGRRLDRDRGEEAPSRRYDQAPDDRAQYDRHGSRYSYDQGGREYDDYVDQRRYDRDDGYVPVYDRESPRKKHRSRRSRDRSRDRHGRSGSRRRHSKGRSSHREEESPRKVRGIEPAFPSNTGDEGRRDESSSSLRPQDVIEQGQM